YDTLGVHKDSTEKEILKAYRKKALKCHPDKNPDNPKASELFHKLSKALEVLTDPKARAAFNNLLNAKERNKLRNQKLDAKRKKFKQDLEESEKSAKQEKESDEEIARRLQAEIERLREEGSRLLQEQQELLKAQIREEEQKTDDLDQQHLTPKLKIKWKSKKSDECNGGYNKELLLALFQKYGDVTHLLISSTRKGSAIVEYEHVTSARMALMNEKGNADNPLTISWLEKPPSATIPTPTIPDRTESPVSRPSESAAVSDRDYENLTLMRLRQAQERKRIIEQMEREE
ncbi:predicted protein, partial [Nematostella vectensis]